MENISSSSHDITKQGVLEQIVTPLNDVTPLNMSLTPTLPQLITTKINIQANIQLVSDKITARDIEKASEKNTIAPEMLKEPNYIISAIRFVLKI